MKNLSIRGDHETILKARDFLVSKGVNELKLWNDAFIKKYRADLLYMHLDNGAIEMHTHNDWAPQESPTPIEITPENYESVLTELINDGSITAGSKQ